MHLVCRLHRAWRLRLPARSHKSGDFVFGGGSAVSRLCFLMRCSVPLIAPLTQRIVYIITHISKNATRIAKFVDFTAFSIRLQRDKTTVFSVSILLFILVLQY